MAYLDDLLYQPKAVADTLRLLETQRLEGIDARAFGRVVLTGMGSSLFACYPLYQALTRRGIDAQMVENAELLYAMDALLRRDTLVIAVSQSGQSAETVALLRRRETAGFTLLGVTNTPGSPLDRLASARVLTAAGVEDTVACKTYLTTLMALAWLEPALFCEDPRAALADFAWAEAGIAAYLADWEAHVRALKARLDGVTDVFVVGRGASLAAASSGGLVTKESTHVHGEGMSSAAFRHGPFEMLTGNVFVLVQEGDSAATAPLNRRLYEDVLAAGARAGWVSPRAEEPVFRIPDLPGRARPLAEILPAQMMTLALAGLRGHTAGEFRLSTKITTTE
jgi:glucosamine--fructose-6-phosphate aminotransferase (isomerizing)